MTRTVYEKHDLRTGWEIRAYAIALSDAGYSQDTIAKRMDISPSRAQRLVSWPRPARARLIARAATEQACTCCNKLATTPGEKTSATRHKTMGTNWLCQDCRTASALNTRQRVKEVCESLGAIPPARELARRVGIRRAQACDLVIDMYGRDPLGRAASRRRGDDPSTWRQLPDGIADDA